MAIKNWHPGKLVMMWAITIVAFVLLMWFGVVLVNEGTIEVVEGSNEFMPIRAVYPYRDAGAIMILVAIAAVITAAGVSWKWFSAREKKE
jgi:formate hydrogenlyase subunit 3/multisubunit Na+/H+ antiporter MnhD subunit